MYKVLLIDDEKLITDGLKKTILETNPHFDIIIIANTAQEALSLFQQNPFDLVFVDIVMPETNGLELISKMSSIQNSCEYIILSGHADFSYAATAIKLDVLEYMLKPVNRKDLELALKRAEEKIQLHKSSATPQSSEAGMDFICELQLESKNNKLVNQTISYIKENITEDISLQKIADEFYVNPSYLSQLVKKETGTTISYIRNKLRIEMAKQMLQGTANSIDEICRMCGYKDYYYFNKIFKKIVGVTPYFCNRQTCVAI